MIFIYDVVLGEKVNLKEGTDYTLNKIGMERQGSKLSTIVNSALCN